MDGGVVCDLGTGLRFGGKLDFFSVLPVSGWAGDWRLVGAGAGLYCGAFACEVAWADGGSVSDQRGCGNSAGVYVECDCRAFCAGCDSVEGADWSRVCSGAAVFDHVAERAAEFKVADYAESDCRGYVDAAANGVARL